MALDTKTKKFVDFYLSELLSHVKSMSEQRLAPVEYNMVKKIAAFLTQSGSAGVDTLASVHVLLPVQSFIQNILGKIQQPDFRMSQMISVLESDSEKILQLFSQILSDGAAQTQLERELQGIGVVLDLETLKKTYAKLVAEKKPPVEPVFHVKTAVSERVSKKEPVAFGKVDDMIGFLSQRRKKSEKTPVREKSAAGAESTDDYTEGKISDRNDFLTELETGIHALGNALKQLKTSLSKTRYIIETADALGMVKKTAKIFDLPILRDCMVEMEQRLNNMADNLDDRRVKLSADSVTALESMAETLGHIYSEKLFPLKIAVLRSLNAASDDFHSSLTEKDAVEDNARQEKGPTDSTNIVLDIAHIAEEDWRVFKGEAVYNFGIISSAANKLRTSADDTPAAKDIHQAARALHASSKLLRLSFLAAHYEILFSIFKETLQRRAPVSPELLDWTEASVRTCSALVNFEAVADSEWLGINTGLMKFTDYKESASASKTDETVQISEVKAATTKKQKTAGSSAGSVLEANEHWVEEFQDILIAHNRLASGTGNVEKKFEAPPPKPVKEEVKEPVVKKVQPAEKPEAVKVKAAAPSTGVSSVEKTHVEVPDELINAMARGELDISDRTILNFADRLSVEPLDIVTPGEKRIKVKTTAAAKVPEAEIIPPPIKKEMSKTVSGSLVLQETNVASVDPEILDIFNQESAGYFKTIDKALEKLQSNIKEDGAVKELERVSHSLKSSSRMLGFESVSGLAAAIELIAERCNENELTFSKDTLELVTAIAGAVRLIVGGQKADVTAIIQKLFNLESDMLAPNIFTAHIPGASEIGIAGMERPQNPSTESKTAPMEQAEMPVPKPEKSEQKAPGENYFKNLGVDEEIVEIFKEESSTYLKLMAGALQTLRSDVTNEHALHDIEKSAHSLRSSAKMLGFQKIGNLARPLEAISERINDGAVDLDKTILGLFDSAVQLLLTLARGTDMDIENVLTQLSRIEKLPAKTSQMDKRDSVQAIQSIKDQLADVPEKTGERKIVKTPADDFDDIELMKDPILKQLSHEEGNVLEDMSLSTQKEVR